MSALLERLIQPMIDRKQIFIRNEKGVALLIVLVIVVLLVTMIVEFDFGTRISLTIAGTYRDGIQANYLAKSGVRAAQAVLKKDMEDSPNYDGYDELWATAIPPYPVGNGMVTVEITDESSKLNINILGDISNQHKAQWVEVWRRLFLTLEIDPDVVHAIIDWVDADDSFYDFSGGAESSYYESLELPYLAKNGPMDSIGELRLISGVTDEVYKKLTTGCEGKPCFTIADTKYTKQINVNTVSVLVCQALADQLTEDDCRDLVNHRPIRNVNIDNDFPPGWTASGSGVRARLTADRLINHKSKVFSVKSKGEVNETIRVVDALLVRKGTKKPKVDRWRVE